MFLVNPSGTAILADFMVRRRSEAAALKMSTVAFCKARLNIILGQLLIAAGMGRTRPPHLYSFVAGTMTLEMQSLAIAFSRRAHPQGKP